MFAPLDVMHLKVNDLPSDSITASDGHGAYLILWLEERPIGHCHLSPAMLPLGSAALADLVSRAVAAWCIGSENEPPWRKETDEPLDWATLLTSFDERHAAASNDATSNATESHGRLSDDRLPLNRAEIRDVDGETRLQAGILSSACPPGDEKSSASLLSRISQQCSREELAGEPSVSVVICTRDRAKELRRCLEFLSKCDPPADEVVVVDNASKTGDTRDVVEAFENVRYVREPRPGLDIARNTGAQAASGEIVAYTDDDVFVYPHWISRIRQAFTDQRVMAITGLVLPYQLETRAQWIFETEWGFNRGYHRRKFDSDYFRKHLPFGVPAWEVGAGANMAFRRDVFDRAGYFDARLDVGAAGCSGDSEYWYRIMAAGMTCRYDPAVVVQHCHRDSMQQLQRQLFAYMRGHATALLVQFERNWHWGNLARLGGWLPLYYLKRMMHRVTIGPSDGFLTIGQEMLGCLSGVLFYLRSITWDRRKWSELQSHAMPVRESPSDAVVDTESTFNHKES